MRADGRGGERRGRLDKKDAAAGKQLVRLLSIPVEKYTTPLTLLQLAHYPTVLPFLSFDGRKTVAKLLVESALRHDALIPEVGPCLCRVATAAAATPAPDPRCAWAGPAALHLHISFCRYLCGCGCVRNCSLSRQTSCWSCWARS
jgi:hypothetical protein